MSDLSQFSALFLERFDTMSLELYFDTDRAVFVFVWTCPGKASVGEYALRDMVGRRAAD